MCPRTMSIISTKENLEYGCSEQESSALGAPLHTVGA